MKIKKLLTLFAVYLMITISLTLYFPEPVEAAQQACCQKTKSGEYCRYTDIGECDSGFLVASNVYCDSVNFCKPGCCFDTVDGACATSVAKSRCETKPNSVWNPDPSCDISQCQLGCCQISNQCSLTTQNKCRSITSLYPGAEMLFHPNILDEEECVNTCRGTEQGACVFSDKSCIRTSRAECDGAFNKNMLCSNPELGTNCAPQQTTNCVGEDVYWFDSCGNQENIYNSNKRASYSSGFIQKEEQVPKAQPNDKNLGNCDYYSGTLCGEALDVKPEIGNYICRDMNCYNVYENPSSPNSGGNKQHGESWCIYDASVGPGKDVVGSLHRRAICVNGEEIIEDCADYREEFCIQNKVEDKKLTDISILETISTDFAGYTEAICNQNRFEDCVDCMSAPNPQQCCKDNNKDCYWANYGNTGSIVSGLCVPLFPPGLKFWEPSSEEICAQATQTCVVHEEKGAFSGWKCKSNCQCKSPNWPVTANKYCKSLGDCGAYYNVEGKFTSGGSPSYKISESSLPSWEKILEPDFSEFYNTLVQVKDDHYWEASKKKTTFYAIAGLSALSAYRAIKLAKAFTAGAGALIAVVVVFVILAVLSDSRDITYTFVCAPWQAPDGGNDCEECNEMDRECTEYLCKSLGKTCELINPGTEAQKCVSVQASDSASPVISPGDMEYQIDKKKNGFEIQGKVPPFSPVNLILDTNEPAECKFSTDSGKDFDEMEAPFGSSMLNYVHNLIIPIPSEATTEEALQATNGGVYQLYVKCKDANGNENPTDYAIKFSIDPGPDQTPPVIESTIPDNNAPIPYGSKEFDVIFLLNEPSNCKWSSRNVDYVQMENTLDCVDSGLEVSKFYPGLYECKTTLKGIEQNQPTTFYLRCEDKSNNIRQENYIYQLVSTPPLQIIDATPTGKIFTKYPALEVVTASGAENGLALCAFSDKDAPLSSMLQMYNTNSTEHSQQLQPDKSGAYDYFVKCVDKAGNLAEEKIMFELELVDEESQIFNIYKDSSSLYISTTEDTTCEYSDTSFTYGTGTIMTGTDTKKHSANLGFSTYHIICEDKFQNKLSTVIYL